MKTNYLWANNVIEKFAAQEIDHPQINNGLRTLANIIARLVVNKENNKTSEEINNCYGNQ